MNSIGLVLVVPAIMKFQFMKAPKNAAIPTNAPRINAIPTSNSPYAMTLPMTTSAWMLNSHARKSLYQPYASDGFAPAGIGPRDMTQFPFTGILGAVLGGTYYWGASFELQTPLYFLPKDAGIKVAAFADAGSLWN